MTEWLIGGGIVLVLLAVAGLAWQGRRDKLSLRDEFRQDLLDHGDSVLTAVRNVLRSGAVAAAAVAPSAADAAAATSAERAAYVAANPEKPVDEAKPFIMNSVTPVPQPKEAAMRDEMTEGPKLVAALPESKYPGVANAYGRVIHWYCEHPESTYQDAYKAVVIDGAGTYASVTEQPYQTGRFPIEALAGNVNASLYLNWISGRFTAATHQSVFVAMLRGDKAAVADFINLGGSTNAGLMSTFNVDAYSSPVKDAVVQAMGA